MDKRVVAIIVTLAAVLLCACPGLFGLFMGSLFALISFIPGAGIDMFGSQDPRSALRFGLIELGAGLIFVLIAAVVVFLVWRRASTAAGQ
jgi:hypothetical protein